MADDINALVGLLRPFRFMRRKPDDPAQDHTIAFYVTGNPVTWGQIDAIRNWLENYEK